MKSNLLLLIPALFITLVSCTKDADESASISDASVNTMANSEDLVLSRTTHTDAGDWQIKMNSVAAKAAAEGIKNFPVNSMLVKEKHDANGNITGYAMMLKAPGDPNAVDGWLWSEYDAQQHLIYSNSERAVNCQSCHVASASRSRE
jgi:hypothetical protein